MFFSMKGSQSVTQYDIRMAKFSRTSQNEVSTHKADIASNNEYMALSSPPSEKWLNK
jgi:hypothetical protein